MRDWCLRVAEAHGKRCGEYGLMGRIEDTSWTGHARRTREVVRRSDTQRGFVVLPRRWVVERTVAWRSQARRLSKDYEALPSRSEAIIYITMIRLMLRRLART